MINGTLFENVKFGVAVAPLTSTTTTALYNGSAVSVTNNGIDVSGFDEAVFMVSVGDVNSSTLDVSLYESDGIDPSEATLVSLPVAGASSGTNASFTQIDENGNSFGAVKTKATKKYLWVVTESGASAQEYAVFYALGKADSVAVSQTADFDIGY